MRILFICHKNTIYGIDRYARRSSGLFNSTNFIVRGLRSLGVDANIVEVQDNNCIDREVANFLPDVCVIEALWVVPEKFKLLKRLHPHVQWFVHMHSNIPFLAQEGIAMAWLIDQAKLGVGCIANSLESYAAFQTILPDNELVFLPNVYIRCPHAPRKTRHRHTLNVGCFGAIRPLKNHLLQALAALRFARELDKHLNFHVNASRIELGGQPALKNLVQLFERQKDADLIQHGWHEPEQFIDILHSRIDIGMQVSLSETFNIVSADCITAGIPVVTSKEVHWVSRFSQAEDDDIDDIVRVLHRAWDNQLLVRWNQHLLTKHSDDALERWWIWLQSLPVRQWQV